MTGKLPGRKCRQTDMYIKSRKLEVGRLQVTGEKKEKY